MIIGINQDLPGSSDRHFLHFALEPMVAGGVDGLGAALPDSPLLDVKSSSLLWHFAGASMAEIDSLVS